MTHTPGEPATKLQQAALPVVSNEKCSQISKTRPGVVTNGTDEQVNQYRFFKIDYLDIHLVVVSYDFFRQLSYVFRFSFCCHLREFS